MSFLAPSVSSSQQKFLAEQSPTLIAAESEAPFSSIDCPIVNIGPWGRDYHQFGERVHKKYAFQELPELLRAVIASIFDAANNARPSA